MMLSTYFIVSYNFQVTAVLNPNCPAIECHKQNFTLIHVKQKGRTDTLHHLWSFSRNFPTLFYARTELDTVLNINWTEMFSGNNSQAISFSKKPQYFAAVILSKVLFHLLFLNNHNPNNSFFSHSTVYDLQ